MNAENDVVNVYEAGDGWRWHRHAANGKIVAESGEAYTRKADAQEAAERVNPGVELRLEP